MRLLLVLGLVGCGFVPAPDMAAEEAPALDDSDRVGDASDDPVVVVPDDASTDDTVDTEPPADDTPDVEDPVDAPTCGNGVLDAGEVCDGAVLPDVDCDFLGLGGGTLGCASDCLSLDTTACNAAPGASQPPTGDLCSDSCAFAMDGLCDDGGVGATTDSCDLGTDCSDCGYRIAPAVDTGLADTGLDDTGLDDTGAPPPTVVIGSGTATCNNACPTAGDGVCDDGGPGSALDHCDLGADCADCGDRGTVVNPPAGGGSTGGGTTGGGTTGGTATCSDTCAYANDGTCDDGGPGSSYSLCDLGSDCGDCGTR
jgi:hypothetical protein